MNKRQQMIARLEELKEESIQREAQTNHVINLRKKLVEQGALLLRSYKDLLKDMNRRGIKTKHLQKIRLEAIHEYQQNINVLVQLKMMNAEARNQVFDFSQALVELKTNDPI